MNKRFDPPVPDWRFTEKIFLALLSNPEITKINPCEYSPADRDELICRLWMEADVIAGTVRKFIRGQ